MSNDLDLYKIQDMIRQIERLNSSCSDNMKRLNAMMLELKGLIAMVRPQVKKTGWYGDEIQVQDKYPGAENAYNQLINAPKFIDVRKLFEAEEKTLTLEIELNPVK